MSRVSTALAAAAASLAAAQLVWTFWFNDSGDLAAYLVDLVGALPLGAVLASALISLFAVSPATRAVVVGGVFTAQAAAVVAVTPLFLDDVPAVSSWWIFNSPTVAVLLLASAAAAIWSYWRLFAASTWRIRAIVAVVLAMPSVLVVAVTSSQLMALWAGAIGAAITLPVLRRRRLRRDPRSRPGGDGC